MGFTLTFQPILLEFAPEQREQWLRGERSDCIDDYCLKLPGTKGFGEYLVGRYWQDRGYRWVHHDYNVLGGNKPGKYPSESILRDALGSERLDAARELYGALYPLREAGRNPAEEPDLLIYKPGTHEIRFAECKRMDSHDNLNSRQALGLYLLGAVLRVPVDVFAIAEASTCASPDPIVFTYPDGRRLS